MSKIQTSIQVWESHQYSFCSLNFDRLALSILLKAQLCSFCLFDLCFLVVMSDALTISRESYQNNHQEFFICQKINSCTQKLCNKSYNRASNLRRHDLKCHRNLQITFVFCNSNAKKRKIIHIALELFNCATDESEHQTAQYSFLCVIFSIATSRHSEDIDSSSRFRRSSTFFLMFVSHSFSAFSINDFARSDSTMSISTTMNSISGLVSISTSRLSINDNRTSNENTSCQQAIISTKSIDDNAHSSQEKRLNDEENKRSIKNSAKLCQSMISIYEVKQFNRVFDQQRGLNWLTIVSKKRFIAIYEALLAQWEITSQHKKTCVLVSQDWRFSTSLDFATLFSSYNHSSSESSRAWYSYVDHATTLVRAVIWYVEWSRTDLDLDIFLECDSYKSMNASHLCHQEHCIIHVIYELANVNQNRKECRRRACFLRREKRSIFEHCTKHNSSCKMQICNSSRECHT